MTGRYSWAVRRAAGFVKLQPYRSRVPLMRAVSFQLYCKQIQEGKKQEPVHDDGIEAWKM